MGQTEEELINEIRRLFPAGRAAVGIGDDAAVFDAHRVVVTSDMLVEDVDFTRDTPLGSLAVKSLSANLSDLAAMGARPTYFMLNLAIPTDRLADIRFFVQSLAVAAAEEKVELIGGDLSASSKLVVSITAFGAPATDRVLMRSGAVKGDRLYVSRPIGGSAAGLHLLRKGWRLDSEGRAIPPAGAEFGYAEREFAAAVLRQHLAPLAECRLGPKLAELPEVHACIDVSDGLSTDLWRLVSASSVGAELEWERLPLFPDLATSGRRLGIEVEQCALHGGEEYALLFTSSLRESELSAKVGRPVYAIGLIDSSGAVTLVRGSARVPLRAGGFDHFSGMSG